MASFDNRSINQPVTILFNTSLSVAAPALTSTSFDVSSYDAGVTIILGTFGISGDDSFDFEIQTSNSSGSGFSVVPDSQLIGGAIPTIDASFNPVSGTVALSRGVVGAKKFIRVRLFNIVADPLDGAVVLLNGATEVSPSDTAEGTAP